MATLVSPGVDVSIINESFYGSAGAGTVPLIVIATAANKTSPSGVGLAPLTVPSEAGKLFLATGQRDLIQNYGSPIFQTSGGTALHGHELNEYGLHAAHSLLGISNRAYILRGDIDLDQLAPSTTAPVGAPVAGTHWLDTSATSWGIFQSTGGSVPGTAWVSKTPRITTANDIDGSNVPLTSFGADGDYCVVPQTSANLIYEKISGSWYKIGGSSWKAARPTTVTGSANPSMPTNVQTIIINSTTVTMTGPPANLAAIVTLITNANIPNISASVVSNKLVIKQTAGGNIVLSGTALTTLGLVAGTYKGVAATYTNSPQYPAGSVAGDVWVKLSAPNRGAAWVVKVYNGTTGQWVLKTVPFYAFNSAVSDGTAGKDAAALAAFGTPAAGTLYAGFDNSTQSMALRRWSGTYFETAVYEASPTAPFTDPEDGVLWYNAALRTDIMVTDGTKWQGYKTRFPNTDPEGVIIAGSAPTTQSDGTALVDNDLWLDASDLENYPALYRWSTTTLRWSLINNTDQTTPFGIVFADARSNSGPTYTGILNSGSYVYGSQETEDMLISDYLDPDAPAPTSYPDGVLLFNTRYSTFNVKVWRPDYFADGGYDANTNFTQVTYTSGGYTFPVLTSTGTWVTASGNKTDGSPYMGRKAQRVMIVRALAAAIASNEEVRAENIFFNLIAAPGYPELMDEMVTLNTDQKQIAFIVGDTPARLKPNGTAITNWATNAAAVSSNGEDGLTIGNPYVGVYYPWGMSTNLDGTDVMVPPSTIALYTIAYSDQVSYPWMAPAGFSRGQVQNASSVGYLTDEDEFKAVILNNGQRDVLQTNKINPIAYIPGRGLVVYGQKTLDALATAEDRINVARLDNYLRYQIDVILKPFIFEPNDQHTRDSARITVERFLSGLVGLRALEDFAVLCDLSNNTGERRDRSELWVDIIYKPVKAVEFIYVPMRLVNSSAAIEF